jgi:predicted RecA/RadA family phage recombinase
MKNFLQDGEIATVPAPSGGVTSGDFIMVGALFGVCQTTHLEGEDVAIVREGVFKLPKATGAAWTKGNPLYWDATAKNFTKTSGANTPVGVAFADAASGDTTGSVSIEAVQESVGKVVSAEIALDGTNPTPVATGLASITSVQLTLKNNSAPGVGTTTLTYDTTAGTLNIYAWKPTSNADPTLIASAGTETVSYTVRGP